MSEVMDKSETLLKISRLVNVSADKLFRAWTEPALLMQWFCPKPWQVVDCQIDLRPGGAFNTVMRGPEGEEIPNQGCFLEIVQDKKLVFTDAFKAGWLPGGKPFMVATVTLEEENGQVRYTASADHWSVEDRESHQNMGFEEGWNKALDQLIELANSL